MKTIVTFKSNDQVDGDYREGDAGYIDGYILTGTNKSPHAIVVVGSRLVMAPLTALKVVNFSSDEYKLRQILKDLGIYK